MRIAKIEKLDTIAATLLVLLVTLTTDFFIQATVADSHSSVRGDKTSQLARSKALGQGSGAATSTTTKRMLQGGISRSRKHEPVANIQRVWGNGRRPDRYVPNNTYRPSPPANQKIHPVASNAR